MSLGDINPLREAKWLSKGTKIVEDRKYQWRGMKLIGFQLRINNPERALHFYTDILGMTLQGSEESENGTSYILTFQNKEFCLELNRPKTGLSGEYEQDSDDNYWKYSLFVDDIQRVYKSLRKLDRDISNPYQFEEIGYLAHTKDLENYQIEFIQKYFAANTRETPPKKEYPLAECPVLGLLTIRTKDPVKIIRFYEEIFNLKLLVRMYVDRGNGFTLYFLGDQNLVPPRPDIDAIENREWMYQQDHLFIEIQHFWESAYNSDFSLNAPAHDQMGLSGITFKGDLEALKRRLEKGDVPFAEIRKAGTMVNEIHLKTLDLHKIIIVQG